MSMPGYLSVEAEVTGVLLEKVFLKNACCFEIIGAEGFSDCVVLHCLIFQDQV